MSDLGKRLRTFRAKQGLSAEEVARRLNVAASTYREWENGRSIKGEPYVELARVLHVSLPELLGVSEQRNQELEEEIQKAEAALRRIRALL